MKLFKDYTFRWWEFGLFKVCLIALGILIGSSWPHIFCTAKKTIVLWVLFVLPAVYLTAVALKQANVQKIHKENN